MTGKKDRPESQVSFEKLAETSLAAITEVDKHGNIVYGNSRAVEVLGFEKSQLTDRTYDDPGWNITDLESNDFPAKNFPFQIVKRTGESLYNVRQAIEWSDGEQKKLSITTPFWITERAVLDITGGIFKVGIDWVQR